MNNIHDLEITYLKAKVAYYEGTPIMSDAAFDLIEDQLRLAGSKVIEQVGAKRKDFDFPHPTPLKSLSKIQTESVNGVTNYMEVPFMQWLNKRLLQLKQANIPVQFMHYSPKFDGSSVNIIYKNGSLESVLTRGDGKAGKDVTDRFRKHLPAAISSQGTVQIRCEAVMQKSVFQAKYAAEFANARNIVAGIIGKDDFDIAKVADIKLVPIHILFNGKHQDFDSVQSFFDTCAIFGSLNSFKIQLTEKDYLSSVKGLENLREKFDYPLDGVVFALPAHTREFLGENDHDPEWSIAIKFVPEEVVTEVTGIEWNIGKTGEFTPVVLLKPVQLAGTTVKRASGYNAGFILKNRIQPGTIVSIHKAGDIIPEIGEVVFSPAN